MKELIHLRTKTSKTYDLGNGRNRLVISGIDPTLTVQPPTKDDCINSYYPTTNYGSDTYLSLGDRAERIRRAILEFDISELPACNLNSATLSMYYYTWAGDNAVGKTVWAYKLTRTDWVELESTWNIYKTGSDWAAGGGDYVTSSPSGGSTTFPADTDAWMNWNVLAIVQDAYDSSNPAEFLVKFSAETYSSVDDSIPYFYSKEYAVDPDLNPKLVIEYEVAGWTGKISGVTNPAKIMGVAVANIAKVKGV